MCALTGQNRKDDLRVVARWEVGVEPIRVLFLAANPSDSTRLSLDKEFNQINDAIRSAEHRDRIRVIHHPQTTAADLQPLLLEHRPHIVHFSGHGNEYDEILFADDQNLSHAVEAEALQALFAVLKDDVRVVLLNACYSETQAQAITGEIDCVIGMASAITDDAAIAFSKAFYRALAYSKSVKDAFLLGTNELHLSMGRESETPKLVLRTGASADDIRLIEARAPASAVGVHVDREQEMDVFLRMLALEDDPHVLLLSAPSGMGKSALLSELWKASPEDRRARVNLKPTTYQPEDVLRDLARQLGSAHFAQFLAERGDTASPTLSATDIGPTPASGFNVPTTGNAEIRRQALRQSTNAFFNDAAELARGQEALVVLFDGFDRGDGDMADWLQDLFLEQVVHHRGVVTVVAGQVAPRVAWTDMCVERTLGNLGLDHIRDLAVRLELNLHPAVIESLYVESDRGHPYVVRQLIEKHVQYARTAGSNA
jgi:hypothetical protein